MVRTAALIEIDYGYDTSRWLKPREIDYGYDTSRWLKPSDCVTSLVVHAMAICLHECAVPVNAQLIEI